MASTPSYIPLTATPLAGCCRNRPQYRNAISMRMTEEMDDCFHRATQDDDVRVIVVKGAGKHQGC